MLIEMRLDMPVLKNIKIQNFKSIWDQDIDLGQLNVFIGSNGAGKSNLLEAIGMLSCAVSGEIEYNRLSERGVRLSAPDVFRSAFKNKDRKNTFNLETSFEGLSYHVNINALGGKDFPWSYHSEKLCRGDNCEEYISGRSYRGSKVNDISLNKISANQSIITSTEALGAITNEEQDKLNALKSFAIYSPSTPILRGVSPDGSNKAPLGLFGGSLAGALSDILDDNNKRDGLQNFFNLLDWFKTIGVTTPTRELQSNYIHTQRNVVYYRDKYMKTNFNKLYAYDVSEGALYILFVIVLLIHEQTPNIFAIDNIDSCLNPSLVTSLMKHIVDIVEVTANKQIFITSHNPTTLDALDLFNDKHRLFVTKRGHDGATIFERIVPPVGFKKSDWEKKYYGLKLSEIWLSGAIGGLPLGGI